MSTEERLATTYQRIRRIFEMSSSYVLDASAILALLNQESGTEVVADALAGSGTVISAVNYAEVCGKLSALGIPEKVILGALEPLGLSVYNLDRLLAEKLGFLYASTRKYGLSLGDRSCLALASHLGLPVLTSDTAWAKLKIGVKIRLLR